MKWGHKRQRRLIEPWSIRRRVGGALFRQLSNQGRGLAFHNHATPLPKEERELDQHLKMAKKAEIALGASPTKSQSKSLKRCIEDLICEECGDPIDDSSFAEHAMYNVPKMYMSPRQKQRAG